MNLQDELSMTKHNLHVIEVIPLQSDSPVAIETSFTGTESSAYAILQGLDAIPVLQSTSHDAKQKMLPPGNPISDPAAIYGYSTGCNI
jgi:hypothetical protein